MRKRFFLPLALLHAAALAAGPTTHSFDAARADMERKLTQAKAQHAGDGDFFVAPGLVADRKAKTVTLLACGTGIGATEPVEFFVAPFDSGKDYESLAMTLVKPSDVSKALEFIGLKPGRPVDFDKNRLWPRGPRVGMTFQFAGKSVRAEDLILDTDRNATLPHTGLVFTGSFSSAGVDGDAEGKSKMAADVVDEKPIAPDFNDPAAVLDVPRRALQSAVYGFQHPSTAYTLKSGEPVTITIAPATGDEAVTSRDITLTAHLDGPAITYTLTADNHPIATAANLPELVNVIAKNLDGKTDWYTQVSLDPAMPVTDVRKLYAVLTALEKDPGLKLDPPAEGNLFHRSFFPEEAWRDREHRLGEPWELFLIRLGDVLSGRLERSTDNDAPAATQPHLLERYPAPDPATFAKAANDHASQWSKVIFIYPPADLTYGELMTWVRPVLATYPRIFVFTPTIVTPAAK